MAIIIQSRWDEAPEWRDEVWRRTQFEAYTAAQLKSRVTGRTYRLVDQNGEVIEVVRYQGVRRLRP